MITKDTNKTQYIKAILLFIAMFIIYWSSIPASFNTKYQNRKFFDSDGEFIVRQFKQNKTFTHNDHLLYHLLGKLIYNTGKIIPCISHNPVISHKLLSVFSGALGITLLYIFGMVITKHQLISLLSALFVGGCSGWWFFSASIDTYIPCLCISILALGLTLIIWENDNLICYAFLGIAIGTAFLLRTDSFLLITLSIVLLKTGRKLWENIIVTGIAVFLTGIVGYYILSHSFYDIAWKDIPAWAFGSLQRPEAKTEKIWGISKNITWSNTIIVSINQLFYTVLLPNMERTRNVKFWKTYNSIGNWFFATYIIFLLTIIFHFCRKTSISLKKYSYKFLFVPALAFLWFISRTIFYVWWDPVDPFLFAVMSLPAIWMAILFTMKHLLNSNTSSKSKTVYLFVFSIITLIIWIHNTCFMIIPIRQYYS